MNIENQLRIFSNNTVAYGLLRNPYSSIRKYGIECGDGWYDLVHEASGLLNSLGAEITQVKQKMGRLVIHVDFTDLNEEIRREVCDIVTSYAVRSKNICEICGNPSTHKQLGFIQYVCETCKTDHDAYEKS